MNDRVTLPDFLGKDADTVARQLLGCLFVREMDGQGVIAKIVETEAYDQTDAASHSYSGQSARNAVMFGPAGRLYVYLSYGIHHCANVVCGPEGFGAGALIRAVEPIAGFEVLRQRRPDVKDEMISNGPGKLTKALGIDFDLLGHDLTLSPLRLSAGETVSDDDVAVTTRIGISKEKDRLRRFYLKSSKCVSRR